LQNILFGVSAISDSNVWAVGAEQDSNGLWHTLTEHWDGSHWSAVTAGNPGSDGDQLYAVQALGPNNVYAVGQYAGSAFPSKALIEHWDGSGWRILHGASDGSASALPLGVSATSTSLTLVGQQETDTAGYTPYVARGEPHSLSLKSAPSATPDENDLFGVAQASDGTLWAVGWAIYDSYNATHIPLILHEKAGIWSLVPNPAFAPGSDSGLASVTAIPGGGLWAVGDSASPAGSYTTLVEYYP
jgi:hypothetical protein